MKVIIHFASLTRFTHFDMHSFYEVFRENNTRGILIKDIVCTEIFEYVKQNVYFSIFFSINVFYFGDSRVHGNPCDFINYGSFITNCALIYFSSFFYLKNDLIIFNSSIMSCLNGHGVLNLRIKVCR